MARYFGSKDPCNSSSANHGSRFEGKRSSMET
ncbi:hypothetical protein FOPG_16639 [Fusarium oxysporum f. sp. conglutinans race 2 54008]|nr:hypothetical protein FOVG_10137 [Fusarium oxysporum f. sp. pisi HDV247]EXL67229.1 hypothetical protein FOPG_16639 [Fusarium oxysporum f. sp. conglutinans race 2 54008]